MLGILCLNQEQNLEQKIENLIKDKESIVEGKLRNTDIKPYFRI